MRMTKQERDQFVRRIMYFYHRVLVDIRNWLHDNRIEIAFDAADLLEPIALDYFNDWLLADREMVLNELHRMIDWFVKKHNTRHYYHELFEIEYDDFINKYHIVAYDNNFHKYGEY